jgi:hypothetical protein
LIPTKHDCGRRNLIEGWALIYSLHKIVVANPAEIFYPDFCSYGNYMKLEFRIGSKCLAGALLSALLPALGTAADIVLQKAPPLNIRTAPAYPENLARFHFGADVKAAPHSVPLAMLQLSSNSSDQNTSEAALLCDDPTTGYSLPAGASSLMVSLSNIENVERVAFLSESAEGDFAVAVANANMPAQSPEWRAAGKGQMSRGPVTLEIGPGDAKYLRIDFNLSRPGRIAAFGVYATPALSDFAMPRPRKVSFAETNASFALINFSLSDVHTRARGLYASSGDLEQISNMIDDQASTTYVFAAADPAPTALIDLGRERSLSRVSAVFAEQPGTIEFYILNDLPNDGEVEGNDVQQIANYGQSGELPKSLKLSEKTIAKLDAVGSVSAANGRAAVNFTEVKGRYLMLRWHPTAAGENAFSVAQVAAFSPPAKLTSGPAVAGEDIGYDKDGKGFLGGKEAIGEGPEEPAEGPAPGLPPAPPFVFIPRVPPEISPVSP